MCIFAFLYQNRQQFNICHYCINISILKTHNDVYIYIIYFKIFIVYDNIVMTDMIDKFFWYCLISIRLFFERLNLSMVYDTLHRT